MNTAPADGLLLQLYACCTDPGRWSSVLDRLCAEVGARSVAVQALSVQGDRLEQFWIAHDSRTDVSRYQAVISNDGNPRLEAKRVARGVGLLVRDEDLFTCDEQPLQRRLQQQLGELGLGRFLGGLLPLGPDQYLGVALHRPVREREDFSSRERERFAAVLPHLAQAVAVGQAVASSHRTEALLRSHLDRWHCGLIVCDADARVQWTNRRARAQLAAGGALALRQGRLWAASAAAQQRLQRALAVQAGELAPGYLALEHGGHRSHLAVQAVEVPPGHVGLPPLLVTLTVDQQGGEIPAAALAALFELTEAESRLASALVAGDTLEQYARRRGVALGTVRYQLKQVLAKTGASRQSDLVRRVLCSAAAHAAAFHAEGWAVPAH